MKIALLGFGVVGRGVYDLTATRDGDIARTREVRDTRRLTRVTHRRERHHFTRLRGQRHAIGTPNAVIRRFTVNRVVICRGLLHQRGSIQCRPGSFWSPSDARA